MALARAIVANQPLCLMDEPLSNLDAKLRASVRKDIKKLQVDLGITVIYVTHDQTEAMSMADMVVLMKDGRIQQTGAPEDLYYRPANTFVAEFVGAPPMALIEGAALPGFEGAARIGLRAENVPVADPGQGRMTCRRHGMRIPRLRDLRRARASRRPTGLTVSLAGAEAPARGRGRSRSRFEDEALHFFDADRRQDRAADERARRRDRRAGQRLYFQGGNHDDTHEIRPCRGDRRQHAAAGLPARRPRPN